ncbi:MAG: O-methyltransferase [Muribaculaceae bacterium]|nr:O-methyltransferase [Muribaculaceae bacterium]
MTREEYILAHIDPEPPHLARLNRHTQLHHLYGHMCSGHIQGRVLAMLVHMIRPGRILELGAFTGYSTLSMAEAMPEGSQLHTVEVNDESADELRATFDASPRGADIHLHIGDAMEIVPRLGATWDMAFIDANKRCYTDYYEMLLPMITSGGYLIADNTLWDDKVLDPETNRDAQTRGIIEFNDLVAGDQRVERVILPLRDGLTIIRKL